MKALITGGLGFIGPHMARHLQTRGYEVHLLDNLFVGSTERAQGVTDGSAIHVVDIRDAVALSKVMDEVRPQVLVHLAALSYIPYCNANPHECYDVNVRGTLVLLRALERSTVERVFFASSAAVYRPSEEPHKEDHPGWPVDVYGFTKRANEFAFGEWSARTGTRVVIGRYFNVYGHGETSPHVMPVLINQIHGGARKIMIGNLSSRRDYIHVTDIARITCDLVDMDADDVLLVNLGTGISHSVSDIIHTLSELSQRPLEITQDPRRMRKQDRPNVVADLSRFSSLALTPPQVSLQDGLRELLDRGVGSHLSLRLRNFLGDR